MIFAITHVEKAKAPDMMENWPRQLAPGNGNYRGYKCNNEA